MSMRVTLGFTPRAKDRHRNAYLFGTRQKFYTLKLGVKRNKKLFFDHSFFSKKIRKDLYRKGRYAFKN